MKQSPQVLVVAKHGVVAYYTLMLILITCAQNFCFSEDCEYEYQCNSPTCSLCDENICRRREEVDGKEMEDKIYGGVDSKHCVQTLIARYFLWIHTE